MSAGAGLTNTTLFFEFSSPKSAITAGNNSTFGAYQVYLSDFGTAAIGATPNNVSVHISLIKVDAPKVERCRILNGNAGINCSDAYAAGIVENQILNTYGQGIQLINGSAQAGRVIGNDIYNCGNGDNSNGLLKSTPARTS